MDDAIWLNGYGCFLLSQYAMPYFHDVSSLRYTVDEELAIAIDNCVVGIVGDEDIAPHEIMGVAHDHHANTPFQLDASADNVTPLSADHRLDPCRCWLLCT